jgi:PAS domain S-box-containing protein
MDLEVFARQIEAAHGRLHSLLRQVGGPSINLEQTLETTFAELNTTFEELHVAEEELLAQQQMIEEERQRYQDLFEFAPDGYLITDQRGMIQQANRAAATLLNTDQQHLTRLPLTAFVVKADVPALLNYLRRLRYSQQGELHEWDLRIQPQHAEPFDAWLRVAPIFNRTGHVLGARWLLRDITVRKRTEAEYRLRESEERLRLAMEAAQMGHWDWDILSGKVVGSWERNQMLGLSSDQIQSSYEQFMACLHPDDREHVARSLMQAQIEHGPYQAEFRVVWPDGSIHWLVGDGRAYYDEAGRAVRMLGVIRDITQRKQAQAELQIVEERLHTVVANVPIILWALDQDGIFTLSEGKGLSRLGLQPGEVVGRSIYDVYAREPSLLDNIRQAFAGKLQSWVQAVDGLLFDVQVTPLRDQQGVITGIIGVSTDITERQRAEMAQHMLAEASALLSASLDYETTLAQVTRLAVPALADLCVVCVQEPDSATQRIEVALADERQAAQVDTIKRLVGDGWSPVMAQAVQREQAILLPDLSDALLELSAPDPEHQLLAQTLGIGSLIVVPLQVREHTIGALIVGALRTRRPYDQTDLVFVKDLAYRVGFAVDNARLYRDAQAAIAARDTFLSIASHELKTPLTSMIGYAYLLQHEPREGSRLTERTRQAVDVIARQTKRLNHLIEDLLDLSRIQRGQWSLVLQPFDIIPLLYRVIEEVRLTSQRHTITLVCVEDELIINGDEGRLEQVIHNLLSNAVKYSPYGGPIVVRAWRHDQTVQIGVADKGIGIPQEAQARLWEPFYRAGNVGKQSSGFGIGLYIAHEIVQRHGGTIAVHSAEGQGSTFTVALPLWT